MWSKIAPAILCFLLMNGDSVIHGQEPLCNKFSFEEQLLEKMVRMEIKVENMFASIAKTQSDIQDLSYKVERELQMLSKEREKIKNEMAAYKADTSKKLSDAVQETGHSIGDFKKKIVRFSSDIQDFKNSTVNIMREQSAVTYIRWGRTNCSSGSKTLYEGYASGSHYSHSGGPSHTICLPRDPQFDKTFGGNQGCYIYNAEYEEESRAQTIFGHSVYDQDVPCAVCEATGKSAVIMIPARMECYEGWYKEYNGYLMTSNHGQHRADLKCVDGNPENVPGQSGDNNGDVFYFVEALGTLPDPPYTRGSELTCVVCTK